MDKEPARTSRQYDDEYDDEYDEYDDNYYLLTADAARELPVAVDARHAEAWLGLGERSHRTRDTLLTPV